MNTSSISLLTQVSGYILINIEWRIAMQEFIDHHTNYEDNWIATTDGQEPVLKLYNKQKEQTEQLRFSPLGSYSETTNTWLWAWANPNFSRMLTNRAHRVKEYGQQYRLSLLTNPEAAESAKEVEIYSIMGTAVYGGKKPVIWLPADENNKLCIMIEDELELPTLTPETFIDIISIMNAARIEGVAFTEALNHYSRQRNLTLHSNPEYNTITVNFEDNRQVIVTLETNGDGFIEAHEADENDTIAQTTESS